MTVMDTLVVNVASPLSWDRRCFGGLPVPAKAAHQMGQRRSYIEGAALPAKAADEFDLAGADLEALLWGRMCSSDKVDGERQNWCPPTSGRLGRRQEKWHPPMLPFLAKVPIHPCPFGTYPAISQ